MLGHIFIVNITIILASGFIAGYVCKRLKVSPLIGYLLVGALIGPGGFDLLGANNVKAERELQEIHEQESERSFQQQMEEIVANQDDKTSDKASGSLQDQVSEAIAAKNDDKNAEKAELLQARENSEEVMEYVTEFGVLLLLFAIGVEFTFDKLTATAKYMFVGGAIQMGVTIALSVLICRYAVHMSWAAGVALGSVVALSSTALVYRSMEDLGQADSKRAQATLGLLIFQDIALVPLLLVLPRVLAPDSAGDESLWTNNPWLDMVIKSALFCAVVVFLKIANIRWIIPKLANVQSNDMVVLYAVLVLLGMCVVAILLGLTPALGALAAGVALGENRLTHQIDALVMPFRETFSAIFFISLGMMTNFPYVFRNPVVCILALAGAVVFKAFCASLALRACGMDSRGALAYGTSVSQIGELAFMILTLAFTNNAIDQTTYDTMLFVSVGSLVLTPNMVKIALTKFGMKPEEPEVKTSVDALSPDLRRAISEATGHAVVVGAGHIGKRVADELIALGASVCLIDFNPVNLHPFSQNGVPTVIGDGADQNVLREAGALQANVVIVTVPRDDLAINVVKAARDICPTIPIAARARYSLNAPLLKRVGATRVLCEEERVADELVDILDRYAKTYGKLAPTEPSATA